MLNQKAFDKEALRVSDLSTLQELVGLLAGKITQFSATRIAGWRLSGNLSGYGTEALRVGIKAHQSAKQERQHNVHQGRCRAYMFVLRVAEELEAWPEGTERQRCWVSSADEATTPFNVLWG